MGCPICGATCRCRNRGPNGMCCGCHSHKSQRGFTRARLNAWRSDHQLGPVPDAQWERWENAAGQRHDKEQQPWLAFEGDERTM